MSKTSNYKSIIIGGTSGIGKAIYNKLFERGDEITTITRNNYKGSKHQHICCDISDDCTILKNKIESFDNIIFSHRYRGTDWDQCFNTTIKGVKNVIEAIVPKEKKPGSVVIISSNASHYVLSEQSADYHSSRAGLEGLMRYYAVKYGKNGIRFNCVLPTTVIKPENKEFFSEENKVRKLIEQITPLGKMGDAEDIANLVEFLCSNKSSYITGNNIFIDGGLSLVGQESIARELTDLKHI
tara:strand:+ start:185 stop:904 length:720 start_codon:yes stop_codon:yes gene_type:complete